MKTKPSKELLYDMYIEKYMTAAEIGKELNIPTSTIVVYIRKYGIKARKQHHCEGKYLDKIFHGWKILKRVGSRPNHLYVYLCECINCGNRKETNHSRIISGEIKCEKC